MALKGNGFVVMCSEMAAMQSIIRMKSDEDKLVPVDDHKLFAIAGPSQITQICCHWVCCNLQSLSISVETYEDICAGEPGDRVQFSEFIIANVRLYCLRNDRKLSTRAVANYTRQELATALRKVGGILRLRLL